MCVIILLCTLFVQILTKVAFASKIDLVNCGVDNDEAVTTGDIDIEQYAWLGVLYYTDEDMQGHRAVTPVALIHTAFCIASAHDIVQMPKDTFTRNARVLLGEKWNAPGRRVSNYVLHPEYGETFSTLAILSLVDIVRNGVIKPLCPPPETLVDPEFYVVRFNDDFNELKKEVIPMYYVPPRLCRDFYVATNLYASKMRPPHVVCACSIPHNTVCVWENGAALVTRDVWGRWQLLGFGVRGPGCSGPSRYLDMSSYYPWIHAELWKYQPVTISKINQHKFVVRATGVEPTRRQIGKLEKILEGTEVVEDSDEIKVLTVNYGLCDQKSVEASYPDYEIVRLYRDYIKLVTSNNQYQFLTYNMSIVQAMEITCMTLEMVNASASSEMTVRHVCPRTLAEPDRYTLLIPFPQPPCHIYKRSQFDISIFLMFSDKCYFEVNIWGFVKNMTLINMLEWRWEEGSYYKDFNMQRVEYQGPTFMTGFGFEPLDPAMWKPDYDLYSTTEFDPNRTEATTRTFADEQDDKPPGEAVDTSNLVGRKPTERWHSRVTCTPTPSTRFIIKDGFLGP